MDARAGLTRVGELFSPPAMSVTSLASFPGRVKHRGEVTFIPAISLCSWFVKSWLVGPYFVRAGEVSLPAMAAPPPEPYFGRCSSLSLSVLIWSVQIRFIDNRSRGKIDKETLGVFVIAPAVLGRIEKTQILIYFITKIVRVIYGFAIQSHFHSISPVLDLI